MGFSDKIISKANKLYDEVTSGNIYRGNSRKAIVFACIFHAYKLWSENRKKRTAITNHQNNNYNPY